MWLALVLGTAHARAFQDGDIPHTTTFAFQWPSLGVDTSTPFVFETATMDEGTAVCRDTDGCLTGRFSTGNGSEGDYTTVVTTANCTPTGPYDGNILSGTRPYTCDVQQSLDITHDGTGTTYSGTSDCGTVDLVVQFILFIPVGSTDRVYTFDEQPFTGTTSGTYMGTAITGTFDEI